MKLANVIANVVLAVAVAVFATPALAQDDITEGLDASAKEQPSEVPELRTTQERLIELEDKVFELEEQLRQQQEFSIRRDVVVTVGGYGDVGFFAPVGSGVGYLQDFSNAAFPEFNGQYSWVFLGDILATAVNSRGEVADLGESPGVIRFDSVDSRGAAGFLANEVNLNVQVGLRQTVLFTTSINFVPRTGSEFALGDFFDLDLAQLEWVASNKPDISLFVGKVEPVIGIEYKERKADRRFGVTPSLIARYTTGSQLGLKGRAKLLDDWVILAAAVTNGSATTEQFHFYDEIDRNTGKTLSGRAAVNIPIAKVLDGALPGTLEIGVSGQWGPQDRATNNDGAMHFFGVDFDYSATAFAVKGQWLTGGSPGENVDDAYGLDLRHGAYVEADWMFLPMIGALVRGEIRDATVTLKDERLYLTKSWRGTVGLRFVPFRSIAVKAEYLHNGEYGGIPEFKNDMFTSSMIVSY